MLSKEKINSLYDNHSHELFVYIYRLTGSYEQSEDILHDCFLNMIKYSQKNEINEKTVRAFLYRSAHNLSINYLKKKSRLKISSLDSEPNLETRDNISSSIEYDELNKKIYLLLDNLDELSRSIFVMRKENKINFEQISKITGKSESTIRRKLQATLDYLEGELKKAGFITFIWIPF